jgi:hypothetical protein
MYTDHATGKTLFELHKNKPGKGLRRRTPPKYYRSKLEDILAGKHPKYNRSVLKKRLLLSGEFRECCDICGFDERRITDYTVPLILDWIDGDNTNHLRENLRFVCYNCYYLNIGNLLGGRREKNTPINLVLRSLYNRYKTIGILIFILKEPDEIA